MSSPGHSSFGVLVLQRKLGSGNKGLMLIAMSGEIPTGPPV